MAENTEAIEDVLDGQVPWDVVGVIEHHIGVLEVPMTNLRMHSTEGKGIHAGRRKEACVPLFVAKKQTLSGLLIVAKEQ